MDNFTSLNNHTEESLFNMYKEPSINDQGKYTVCTPGPVFTLKRCVGTATLLVPSTWYFTNFFGGFGRNFLPPATSSAVVFTGLLLLGAGTGVDI